MKRQKLINLMALLLVGTMLFSSCRQTGETTKKKKKAKKTTTTSESVETTEAPSETTSPETEESSETSASSSSANSSDVIGQGNLRAEDEFADKVRSLPCVVSVERLPEYEENQYMVYYEMPLDHNDPEKGTFYQRMYIYYLGEERPNHFYCSGYSIFNGVGHLFEEVPGEYDVEEFSRYYECNFIEPEYRFDGESLPEGFAYDNPDYWEYLTCSQAADDFHLMITGLKTILSGKWCFEGMSKGGEFTAYHLSRYPDDCDLFIAEAAMLRCNRGFPGMYEYTWSTAGDVRYGKEKAKEYRDLVLAFQVEAIKNREELVEMYYKEVTTMGLTLSEEMTPDILFDCAVLDLAFLWQYDPEDTFKDMADILSMKDQYPEQYYLQEFESILVTCYGPWQYELDGSEYEDKSRYYNFVFQCYREDGYYAYDASYLREALEKDGSGAKLSITEDMEEHLYELRVYKEHRERFSFDPSVSEARSAVVETTTTPLILINGLTDEHHVAEITETNNPNVHIFNLPENFHDETQFVDLSIEDFNEFDSIVRETLSIT